MECPKHPQGEFWFPGPSVSAALPTALGSEPPAEYEEQTLSEGFRAA